MNVWIFNHHALTPGMSGGTRHYDFGVELANRGHEVTIVASSFHYAKYQEMKRYGGSDYLVEYIDGIRFIWIQTKPYFGNGLSRVRNMLNYSLKVQKIMPNLGLSNPNIIVGSSVHLFAVWSAYRLSRRYKTPFIMEVRDLWPRTLIDMGMPKWHPFIIILAFLEKYLYKNADKIISSLPYADEYISQFVEQEKVCWISNGVNIKQLEYLPPKEKKGLVITYTGAIGIANNLQPLLDVALKLHNKKDIVFRIIGDGAEKERIKQFVSVNKLDNVSIKNAVPKTEVSALLQESDVLFLSLLNSPLYKYGISLNKLFDYMASGRVIIFHGNARNNPIKEANAGFSTDPDDIEALKNTILEIYALPHEERVMIGEKIRHFVEKHYAIEHLVDKFEDLLVQEIERKSDKTVIR